MPNGAAYEMYAIEHKEKDILPLGTVPTLATLERTSYFI